MTSRAAAARYARALFDVALREADISQAGRDIAAFADLVGANPLLARVLTTPGVPPSSKRTIVEQLLARAGAVTPPVAKLLLLLAERDRLVLLPDLAEAYRARLMQHANVVEAQVVTAVPLPPDRVTALQQGLARATGRDVRLESRVDPAIVGGAVTRIGSLVYDGSVVRQLEKMKDRLSQEQ